MTLADVVGIAIATFPPILIGRIVQRALGKPTDTFEGLKYSNPIALNVVFGVPALIFLPLGIYIVNQHIPETSPRFVFYPVIFGFAFLMSLFWKRPVEKKAFKGLTIFFCIMGTIFSFCALFVPEFVNGQRDLLLLLTSLLFSFAIGFTLITK